VLVALALCHCPQGTGQKKTSYASQTTSEMRNAFAVAENFYRQQNYQNALESYVNYIKSYPYTALTDESYYKIAKIYFLKKNYPDSIANFESIVRQSPDPAYVGKALHYAGYAAYMNQDYAKAYDLLRDVKPATLPVKLRLQFFSLAVSLAEKEANYQDFSDYALLRLYDTYEEVAVHLRDFEGQQVLSYGIVGDRVQAWLVTPIKIQDITKWMRTYPVAPAKELVDYKIAKTYFAEKPENKITAGLLNTFLKNYPRSRYVSDVKKMLKQIGVEVAVTSEKPFVVGLITPSSDGAIYGDAVMEGLQCAAGINGLCGENSSIRVVKLESGSDQTSLRAAFEGLQAQKVAAVIALVPGQLTVQAATIGAELQIPTFLISQQAGLMKQGRFIFQMGLVPEKQIEDLVATAIKKGQKRFVIYYPDISYGQVMSTLFEKEATSRGGKIIAKMAYKKGSPDPYEPAEALKKVLDAQGDKKSFDAMFVPDSYLQLDNLITGLQFYKLTGFPLLGTNAWNDARLTNKINGLYPGSVFVDLYDANDNSEIARDFQARFSQSFGKSPSVLHALGYDSMMIVRNAVSQAGASKILETLSDRFGYRGVTGVRGFELGKAPVVQTSVIPVKSIGGR